MKILGETSIRRKLMLMLLLTSCSALVLSAIGFALNDWMSQRSAMFNRLQAQAQIIGNNSLAALAFGDPDSADSTLVSLKNEGDIVAAVLFNREGHLFASYRRDADRVFGDLPNEAFGTTEDGYFYVVHPIVLDGTILGRIMVISDLRYWKDRQLVHLLIAAAVLVLSLLAALLLSSRLQALVSEPILKLAETARQVSERQDYGLRAEKLSADEIGSLVDDFNGMLRQIQLRDHELQKAREQLEEKVQARTLELTELAKQLEHQAYHDTLTGLANRITFDDHLRLAIDQAKRHGQRLAVMFLDLDRFKIINDTLGHAVGDKLLVEVSRRLSACLRECDTLARLGGDEFAVLLTQIRHDTDAADVAIDLIEAIAQPIPIDGYNLHVTTSIGISVFPEDGGFTQAVVTNTDIAIAIVKNADTAMYLSKDRGRNQYSFFSAEMNLRAVRRLALETKLRQAIAQNALTVYYQPRCDALTQALVGVEALARWHDPNEGFISPVEFIPLAEECGLIAAIDEWVLERACRDMLSWSTDPNYAIRLAVNLSPAQFIRKDLFEVIATILQETGFPGDRLELEITESLFGPGSIDACQVLEQLRQLGIELSIDDFGTAYSSLSRLKQLPLHTLKIDKSFVRDLGHDPDDEILVRTIIAMAHSLDLKVVAEGVETEQQYDYVRKYGCDTVQGFLFGKPVPYHQLEPLLRKVYRASRV